MSIIHNDSYFNRVNMTMVEKTGCTSLAVDVESGHTRDVTASGLATSTTLMRWLTISVHITTW